jgi:hypothetical protein
MLASSRGAANWKQINSDMSRKTIGQTHARKLIDCVVSVKVELAFGNVGPKEESLSDCNFCQAAF